MTYPIYIVINIFLLIVYLLIIKSISRVFHIFFALFIFFTVLGSLSVLYIEKGIYIVEQGQFSQFTGAAFRLNIILIIHALFLKLFDYVFKNHTSNIQGKIRAGFNNIQIHRGVYIIPLCISFCILFLCFVNVIISENIPFFTEGYISRFDYLSNTILWPILSFFGSTTSIIPILSGYVFLKSILVGNQFIRNLAIINISLYIYYIVLIGQKFGGILFGLYYFIVPFLIYVILTGKIYKYYKKMIVPFLVFISLVSFLLIHHYSRYSLSQDFGGPIQFIIYRALGLQGHTWWGIDKQIFLDESVISTNFDFNLMHMVMRTIGLPGVESAIERGVNFTFGLYPGLILGFGPFIGIILLFFISLFFYIHIILVLNLINKGYIMYLLGFYSYIWFYSFISIGNMELFFEPKSLVIYFLLFIFILYFENKKNYKGVKSENYCNYSNI